MPETDKPESKANNWVRRVRDFFGVLPKKVPILDLYKNKNLVASFKPMGRWVVGANGRIDILTHSGAFILIDVSEEEDESEWKVFAPNNRKKGIVFDSELIGDVEPGRKGSAPISVVNYAIQKRDGKKASLDHSPGTVQENSLEL